MTRQETPIKKINIALYRIEVSKYGICVVTGKPIQKKRLEAIPYVVHSVEAVEEHTV